MTTSMRTVGSAGLALALLMSGSRPLPAQGRPAVPDRDAVPEAGVNVQARGPLHEAFAQPADKDPTLPPVVHKQPPPPIPEEPPDQKPQGDDVKWLPGYWAWDSDRNDFLWVSGFWRVPPPERQWVPGQWTKTADGWQWAPGFWEGEANGERPLLPEPPASVENGPSAPAPTANSFYVPGQWKYRNTDFVWRPGFWSSAAAGWVWNPSCYRWTPAGYVSVDGYWDYPLDERGLLFAPVYFERPLWLTPGWSYRPRFVVGYGGLLGSLFVRPGYGYYFGDYYDPFYFRAGFLPWYAYGPRYHDPLFSYYRWSYRGNAGWYAGLRNVYVGRRDGTLPRPPRTFAQQRAQLAAAGGGRPGVVGASHLVTPLNQYRNGSVPLARVSAAQLSQERAAAQRSRDLSSQRNRIENSAARPAPGRTREALYGSPGGSSRYQLPATTAAARMYTPQYGPSRSYSAPAMRSAPSFSRSAPSVRGGGGSSFHGGGGHGGGHGGGGHH